MWYPPSVLQISHVPRDDDSLDVLTEDGHDPGVRLRSLSQHLVPELRADQLHHSAPALRQTGREAAGSRLQLVEERLDGGRGGRGVFSQFLPHGSGAPGELRPVGQLKHEGLPHALALVHAPRAEHIRQTATDLEHVGGILHSERGSELRLDGRERLRDVDVVVRLVVQVVAQPLRRALGGEVPRVGLARDVDGLV